MRFLIVDDHPLVRGAIEGVLRRQFPHAEISTAISHEAGAHAVLAEPVDAVITDLLCCRPQDLKSLPQLVEAAAPGRVVVLGRCSDIANAKRAHAAGVHGYVPATAEPELVGAAIALVLLGGVYFPILDPHDAPARADKRRGFVERLSPRQREVLQALRAGKSNKDIAEVLGISVGTVKLHVQAILKHANAHNRSEVVMLAASQDGDPAAD